MEAHPIVYIRTDGNETIATGHLMRCLSIARALRRRGARTVFVVSDVTSLSLLQKMQTQDEIAQRAFPVIHMQTDYRDLNREIPTMQRILSANRIACFLVDSYYATPRYLSSLKKICRVAYIDDLQAFDPPADMILNYDITVEQDFYKSGQKLLCGGAYTPLREQFSQYACHPWDTVKDLFISTGGTDPFDIAGGLVRRLLKDAAWEDVRFHVLTGPMHVHKAELESLAEEEERIELHENVTEMAALMSECDLAFCAGGTTLYELCAVGVPSVSYSMADNQLSGVKAFDHAGLIPWAGDIRDNPDFYEQALQQLYALASDPQARKEQSVRMRMTIDGAGADRIAEALTAPLPA